MIYPLTAVIIIITFIFLHIKFIGMMDNSHWSYPPLHVIGIKVLILLALMWIISYIFFKGTNWMPIYKV